MAKQETLGGARRFHAAFVHIENHMMGSSGKVLV